MALYEPGWTLAEARRKYFALNNFGDDGGYSAAWVKMKVGPVPIGFPNTRGRVEAVRFHDLHHVLTEYPTTWRGETEIGAWEVATGCERFYQGWLLNLLGFALGLVINPRGVYAAFMRGRRSRNLYASEFNEELLASRVGDVRRRLRLDAGGEPATAKDKVSFAAWALASAAVYVATGAALLAPLVLSLLAAWWFVW
ncbi:MAG TPA: hypothetical protein VER08_07385 [Pyrinomonadaceae bacterium]|nr:hypothetical protein [Pyrinomonadaceae bacterium]